MLNHFLWQDIKMVKFRIRGFINNPILQNENYSSISKVYSRKSEIAIPHNILLWHRYIISINQYQSSSIFYNLHFSICTVASILDDSIPLFASWLFSSDTFIRKQTFGGFVRSIVIFFFSNMELPSSSRNTLIQIKHYKAKDVLDIILRKPLRCYCGIIGLTFVNRCSHIINKFVRYKSKSRTITEGIWHESKKHRNQNSIFCYAFILRSVNPNAICVFVNIYS